MTEDFEAEPVDPATVAWNLFRHTLAGGLCEPEQIGVDDYETSLRLRGAVEAAFRAGFGAGYADAKAEVGRILLDSLGSNLP